MNLSYPRECQVFLTGIDECGAVSAFCWCQAIVDGLFTDDLLQSSNILATGEAF